MTSIRVGMITFDWYPFDPRVRRLAEAAIDGGCEVDIICIQQEDEERYEVYNQAHIYRMPMKRGFGRSLPETILSWCWFLIMSAVVITRLHLKHPYDVIHVHNMPDFLVFAAFVPKLLGAKVILDVQDVSPELMVAKAKGRSRDIVVPLATWQERISTAFAHHVVTVGWPFEELLLKRGVSPEKLTIVLNSTDPKLFPVSYRDFSTSPSVPDAEHPLILMYHGTLAYRNGLDIAVQALAQALPVAPHLRLDIMGRGEQLPALKELAARLGVSDRVTFTEPCPSEKIVDFVAHGHVGIIPYRSDGFMELVLPTKAYEYAWMHRPMIASDNRALRSMFQPESIYRCDCSLPESFAEAIIDLYQHPEKRADMVAAAAEDYQAYQWEVMARRYCQLLTALSQKTGPEESVPVASNITSI
ncbi:MAG TPA: glycosyltransferase family 4 protein [Ktedonobacteraceae bacterium]|nr:glycosyltransferase family 4 protein [Ktedonobacteraceae bacterium]